MLTKLRRSAPVRVLCCNVFGKLRIQSSCVHFHATWRLPVVATRQFLSSQRSQAACAQRRIWKEVTGRNTLHEYAQTSSLAGDFLRALGSVHADVSSCEFVSCFCGGECDRTRGVVRGSKGYRRCRMPPMNFLGSGAAPENSALEKSKPFRSQHVHAHTQTQARTHACTHTGRSFRGVT
jgi:hypothetical protein